MIVVLCISLVLLAVPTQEQNAEDPSPCPKVFMYGPSQAKPGRWYGVINLSTDTTLHSLWLNVLLDDEAWVLGNSIGNVTTNDNKNFRIENSAVKITPGLSVTVYFYVQYNHLKKVPKLLAIRLNGKEICNFVTKFTPPPPRKDVNANSQKTNAVSAAVTAAVGTQSPIDTNTKPQGQSQCGKVSQVTNASPVGGSVPTLEEQWPWQIALYKSQNVDNKYICGGTLVTARHVITAAHCVTRKSTKRVVDRHTLTVYLGKLNLRTSVDGVQISFVKEITVHPEYNASTYARDVAILELNRPLKYTNWVRPVCLWPILNTDLKNVVGKEGLLIGWVFDDVGQVVNDLFPERMPIASQETCSRSHTNFFTRFTSEYTYCSGNRNQVSWCPSAGSGMVFMNSNTWYLRGLVSLSVPKQNSFQCDSRHYVVFTDLAQFLPWINSIVYDF